VHAHKVSTALGSPIVQRTRAAWHKPKRPRCPSHLAQETASTAPSTIRPQLAKCARACCTGWRIPAPRVLEHPSPLNCLTKAHRVAPTGAMDNFICLAGLQPSKLRTRSATAHKSCAHSAPGGPTHWHQHALAHCGRPKQPPRPHNTPPLWGGCCHCAGPWQQWQHFLLHNDAHRAPTTGLLSGNQAAHKVSNKL
jgi:hypothetical protein